jgi:hypothetical protein
MAYARYGQESDVYVYEDAGGGYTCERCPRVGGQFKSKSAKDMAAHLTIHVASGDKVPPSAIAELEQEPQDNRENGMPRMHPFTDVHEAIVSVDSYSGQPEDFVLPIGEVLLDPVGIHMALITDRILARGWDLDGFEQASGYRIYRYKRLK